MPGITTSSNNSYTGSTTCKTNGSSSGTSFPGSQTFPTMFCELMLS